MVWERNTFLRPFLLSIPHLSHFYLFLSLSFVAQLITCMNACQEDGNVCIWVNLKQHGLELDIRRPISMCLAVCTPEGKHVDNSFSPPLILVAFLWFRTRHSLFWWTYRMRDSLVVWDLYRLTCGGGFCTPPWLTWCRLNKQLKSSWKRSSKRTHTHTHTLPTHSCTYTLSLCLSHLYIRITVTLTVIMAPHTLS